MIFLVINGVLNGTITGDCIHLHLYLFTNYPINKRVFGINNFPKRSSEVKAYEKKLILNLCYTKDTTIFQINLYPP